MGSPGVFIHSGALGGKLSAFSVAADASLPARPPATTIPPTSAPPLRRNRRRDVTAGPSPMSVGWLIVRPPLEIGRPGKNQSGPAPFPHEGRLIFIYRTR